MKNKVIALLSIFILVIILLITFLLTPRGINASGEIAKKIVPGKLNYRKISGTMSGKITLRMLNYKNATLTIKANKTIIKANPLKLITGKIDVTHIHIDGAIIKIKSSGKKFNLKKIIKELVKISLPNNISVKKIIIKDTTILYKNRKIHIKILTGKINLDGKNNSISLSGLTSGKDQSKIRIESKKIKHSYVYKININSMKSNLRSLIKKTNKSITINLNYHNKKHGSLIYIGRYDDRKQEITSSLKARSIKLGNLIPDTGYLRKVKINAMYSIKKNHVEISASGENRGNSITAYYKSMSNYSAAKWSIKATRIQSMYSSIAGNITTNGTIIYKNKTLQSKGKIKSSKFVYKKSGVIVNNIDSNWDINSSQKTDSNLDIEADRITLQKLKLHKMKLEIHGNTRNFDTQFKTKARHILIQLISNTSLKNGIYQTSLRNSHLLTPSRNKFNVYTKHPILYNPKNTTTKISICTSNKNSRACANISMIKNKWSAKIKANEFPLSIFLDLANIKNTSSNLVKLNLTSSGSRSSLKTLNSTISLSAGETSLLTSQIDTKLKIHNANTKINLIRKTLFTKTFISLVNKDYVKSSLNYSLDKGNPIKSLNIDALIHNIKPYITRINNIHIHSGSILAAYHYQPPSSDNKIKGKLLLKNISLSIPKYGSNITDISGSILSNKDSNLIKLKAYFGKNPININGGYFPEKSKQKIIINITGKNIQAINNAFYSFTLSPKLQITIMKNNIYTSGDIYLNKGDIKYQFQHESITPPYDAIVFSNNARSTYLFNTNINLKLSNDIHINAYGLNGFMTGKLIINSKNSGPLLATGSLNLIKGTFKAYGVNLKARKNSSLIFNNSMIYKPSLSLSAYKIINSSSGISNENYNNITIGVNVKGPVDRPIISLFSIPSTLSQTDMLSYLLLGYSLENTNSDDNQRNNNLFYALQIAGTGLGGEDFTGINSILKKSIGIDYIGLESPEDTDALGNKVFRSSESNLTIAKRINRNLLISYSQYNNTLLAKLNLSKKIYLQISNSSSSIQNLYSTSTAMGIDLYYSQDI